MNDRAKFKKSTRTARSLGSKFIGFGASTVLLAVASLVATPVMVAADGPAAWGAIALGQSIGAVGCLVASFGWALSGPTVVARGDTSERLREYEDSVRVKLTLILPASATSALVASMFAAENARYAVAGAVATTMVSLTSNWYFAGVARPYLWLLMETLPRVAGTGVGILLMSRGSSAIVGLACTAAGMVAAFILVTCWIYVSAIRAKAERLPPGSLRGVFAARRHGIASMVGAQTFLSVPIAIVSLLSPDSQPVFALADKVRQLVSAGLNPVVVVLQGWVPRGGGSALARRSRHALAIAVLLDAVFCAVFLLVGPRLMNWLGNNQIAVGGDVVLLTAVVVAVDLFNSVLVFAVLSSFGRLGPVTRATYMSIGVMLPLVAIGSYKFGALGALAGMAVGLVARIVLALAISARRR